MKPLYLVSSLLLATLVAVSIVAAADRTAPTRPDVPERLADPIRTPIRSPVGDARPAPIPDRAVEATRGLRAVPATIPFQGFLADGTGTAVDGTVDLDVALYDVISGGTPYLGWAESYVGVVVSNGVFHVELGSLTPFPLGMFSSAPLYLGVSFDGETELPRTELGSTPFAMRSAVADSAATAGYAATAGHAAVADSVLSGGGGADDDWTIAGSDMYSAVPGNVGVGTTTPATKLDVQGELRVGQDGSGFPFTAYGTASGSKALWDPAKSAFRAGIDSDGTHWVSDSLGTYSFGMGRNTSATGTYSFGTGKDIEASGYASSGFGEGSTASGDYSVGMGRFSEASGYASIAIGNTTTATNNGAVALGSNTKAEGFASTALGYQSTAAGNYSAALGRFVQADSLQSMVIGKGVATGDRLVNDVRNSLMVGFETTTPTLFVGGANDRVGIGTKTPAEPLDVAGTMKADGLRLPTGATAGHVLTCTDGTGAATWQAATGGTDADWTVSGDDLYSTPSGNVGIGTATPAAKLDVQGNVQVGADGTGFGWTAFGDSTGGRALWYPEMNAFRAGADSDGTHWAPDSIGLYSFAAGIDTKATGQAATAMGYNTTASGVYSTAVGVGTKAGDFASTAMGFGAVASGFAATALGYGTRADGGFSTAAGDGAWARGDHSIALGEYISADSTNTVVIGQGDSVSKLANDVPHSLMVGFETTTPTFFVGGSAQNHGVGIGTSDPSAQLDVAGTTETDGFRMPTGAAAGYVLTASDSTGAAAWQAAGAGGDSDWTVSGDDMYSTPSGNVGIGTTSPAAKLHVAGSFGSGGASVLPSGFYSVAMGEYVQASGDKSIAVGDNTTASGDLSVAMGDNVESSGHASTALGYWTQAGGQYALATGRSSVADGVASTAQGYEARASADYSQALGRYVRADSLQSVVIGEGASSASPLTNDVSHSLMVGFETATPTLFVGGSAKNHSVGIGTSSPFAKLHVAGSFGSGGASVTPSGIYSVAMGEHVHASGTKSFAIGDNTTASGELSVATGFSTESDGYASTAMGSYTQATGNYSVALGDQSRATASRAVAMGDNAVASGVTSLAMGVRSTASGAGSIAFGLDAIAAASHAIAMGECTWAESTSTVTIGEGVDTMMPLRNDVPHSLMIGFETETPTLFVGGSAQSHSVGIGTKDPQALLSIQNAGSSDTVKLLNFSENETAEFFFEGGFSGTSSTGNSIKLKTTWGSNPMTWRGDGAVGIKTESPAAPLHVDGGTDVGVGSGGYLAVGDVASTNITLDDNEIMARDNGAAATLHLNAGSGDVALCSSSGGNVGIGTSTPTVKLQVGEASDGSSALANSWGVHSSREYKRNIVPLDGAEYEEVLRQVRETDVVRYEYSRDEKRTRHIGVIAEDAPTDILAADGKAVSLGDYAGFLLAAVKAQQEQIEGQNQRIAELRQEIRRLRDSE